MRMLGETLLTHSVYLIRQFVVNCYTYMHALHVELVGVEVLELTLISLPLLYSLAGSSWSQGSCWWPWCWRWTRWTWRGWTTGTQRTTSKYMYADHYTIYTLMQPLNDGYNY